MTDDELEQRLRTHYRDVGIAPVPGHVSLRIEDGLTRRSRGPAGIVRTRSMFAVAMATILLAVVGLGLRPNRFGLSVPNVPATVPSVFPSPVSSVVASPAPSASPAAPTPLPPGPDVQAGGPLGTVDGWALTGQRLLITSDGGSTWRDRTPSGGSGSKPVNLKGIAFLDPQHGWVASAEGFTSTTDPSYGRIDVWRTTDGGQHWTRSQLPKAVLNQVGEMLPDVQFDFLDAEHGFAFLSGNLAKGANDSDLFATSDGGRTWSADRPTGNGSLGIAGTVAFSTTGDGVIVNALHGRGIVVSRDGGRTWTDAAFAMPPGSEGAQLFFDRPVFFDGTTGLVVVAFQTDSGTVHRVYRTLDAGSSWSVAATLPTDFGFALAFSDLRRWIGVNDSEVVRTVDGGQTWLHEPAVGLPAGAGSLQMADAGRGWALVEMNVCLTFKSNCSSRTGLYATTNGGSTWTQLWPG